MSKSTTYTNTRAKLKPLCDQVISTREPIIIHRRNIETAQLIRSPANARRLLTALNRTQKKT